jgi:hypothetical protein
MKAMVHSLASLVPADLQRLAHLQLTAKDFAPPEMPKLQNV